MSTRAFRTVGTAAFFLVLLAIVWFSRHVLLLLFAGLLMALVLTSLTNVLRRVLPVGHKPAYAIVLVSLALLLWGTGRLIAPSVTDQFSELAERLPELFSELREKVEGSSIYQKLEGAVPDVKDMIGSGGAGKVTKFFSSTLQSASSIIFIGFTAVFLAATPQVYRRLLIKLFPPRLRDDAAHTTNRVICVLKYWLLGQVVAMALVGVLTGVSLGIAGIPLAVALGIVAGIAEFIPIFGPIFASIPALLLASSEGSDKFLIVLAIFLVIQMLEGNVITPIVQRKAIDLPPVITLMALLLLGGSFGILGMFVAAPFAAMVLVLIEDIYLQRYLNTTDKLLT